VTKLKETKDVVASKIETLEQEALPPVQTPMEMIALAIKSGAGEKELGILERMFEFDLKVKGQQAIEAYNDAMAKWKANAPQILKDKEVSYTAGKGKTSYHHATLGNVANTINASMSPFGLHASWKTEQPEGKIRVTCTISHRLGHSESTSLTADADTSGSKNAIQALGSTITYLERYTLLALTGLATHDQDDDGKSSEPVEYINDSQYADIVSILQEIGKSEQAFCKYKKVESLDKLLADQFEAIVKELDGWRK
jgi:hypothetical protein